MGDDSGWDVSDAAPFAVVLGTFVITFERV